MKRIVAFFLITAMVLATSMAASAVQDPADPTVRIGLYYGSGALPAASLANEVGAGYSFGYFDSARDFVTVGYTGRSKITMLKDTLMYMLNGSYYDSAVSGGRKVGCYHLDAGLSFSCFEEAESYAQTIRDTGWPAFPAYVMGEYRVRIEHYSTAEYASADISKIGIPGLTVVFPGDYCVTVVDTATSDILFEFDCGSDKRLGVMPSASQGEKALTWFKGYKYYGGFEYRRAQAGNITVINFVLMQDYVKGVVPYEMSPSWPKEALKAQALCAKTYAISNLGRYSSQGFDLNNTVECQVYRGANTATANSDAAVDETYGSYITYGGKYISAVFHSSNGGSTESAKNVWGTDYPYLRAVIDNFEDLTRASYGTWSYNVTGAQFKQILTEKGYAPADIVNAYIDQYTEAGNVYRLTIVDAAGKKYNFEQEKARVALNNTSVGITIRSQRYSIGAGINLYTLSADSLDRKSSSVGLYAIGSGGTIGPVSGGESGVYVKSTSGAQILPKDGSGYVISGSGWGHNVGMSQWGARGMAEQGYTYKEIIKYYYSGVEITAK